jgi:hypothetical protein
MKKEDVLLPWLLNIALEHVLGRSSLNRMIEI